MKLTLDTDAQTLTLEEEGRSKEMPLYSKAAFEALSKQWLRVGWDQKYPYTFSWFGRPVIQLPEDMVRMQEVIHSVQPDVIIETGVAHGGSLIFYASLCKAMGKGRIIGIDIEIRSHNRQAIEEHFLSDYITLIEGSSTAADVLAETKEYIGKNDIVLVILDSNHSYQHVREELRLYAPLVTDGSYIVATDGSMRDLTDVPRGKAEWADDNPAQAAEDFVKENDNFIIEQPYWPFNESNLDQNITHWPNAWIKKAGNK
ncbi:cephalosporin hydroxylase family protein [Fodinicurvata sediminis]|uniref:cephalosporin hydroxylase family protein n=1 Tax=Fodinicurvata sediminis TaxID=1121832 RepID=UPI0003B74AD5|nr:CmcI family methyltransferase [Fodinicurvata sediminis]